MPTQQPDTVEIAFAARLDEISSQLNQLGSKFETFAQNASSKFGGLGSSVDALLGKVKALLAGFLGLEGMRRAVVTTEQMTSAQIKLAQQMGITAAEASILDTALGDIYSSTEEYAHASQFLTRQLRTNEERLNDLGLKTRDSNGNLRNQKELLLESIGILNDHKQGTDRNTAATEFFGRSADSLQNFLKLNNEVLEKAREKNEALGLTMTTQGKVATEEYKAAMNDLGDVGRAITKVIGEALMPVITNFARWIASEGKSTVETFTNAFKILGTVLHFVSGLFRTLWEIVKSSVQGMVIMMMSLGDAMERVFRFDFSGASAAMQRGFEQIVDIAAETKTKLDRIAEETKKGMAGLWNPDTTPAGRTGAIGTRGFVPEKKGTMAELDSELAIRKAAYEREQILQGTFQRFSLQMEKEYWQQVLDTAKLSTEERKSLTKKMHELDAQLVREELEREKALAVARIESRTATGLDAIQVEREMLRRRLEMGEITKEERLLQERDLETRSYELKRKALEDKIQLENEDIAKRQQMIDQLEVMDGEHQQNLQRNTTDSLIATRDRWMSYLGSISSAFDTSIKGMILGTTTFREAMRNMGVSILGEFINMTVKMATQWIATQIAMTTVAVEQTVTQESVATAAAIEEITLAKIAASSEITSYAAAAAVAAMSSVAAIPFYGWAMAPGVGASTFATGMAYQAALISAEGGAWDLRDDSLLLAHKREMVLPQDLAEGVRNLVENGGGRGDVFAPTISITALDARSVKRLLTNEGSALVGALKTQMRNFAVKK